MSPTPLHLFIGAITNFFDTLGIGSYATTTAMFRGWRLVPDELIPGTLNVGHTLPTIAQAYISDHTTPENRAKAFGVIGGYITGSNTVCDFVRSFASGFIFSSALPPAVAAGALTSIRHLKASSAERERHQDRVAMLRRRLDEAGVAHLDNPSHIVPVMVRDPVLCKQISDVLLDRYGIYVQPINYPTVPKGTERLRLTPTPLHDAAMTDALIAALQDIWRSFSLRRAS